MGGGDKKLSKIVAQMGFIRALKLSSVPLVVFIMCRTQKPTQALWTATFGQVIHHFGD